MASTTIHLAVAKLLEKDLKINNQSDYYIGTIIADSNINRKITHFIKDDKSKSLENFINEYPNYKENNFLLGYYIHLYTDILWREYIKKVYDNNKLILKNNQIIELPREKVFKLFHNNYSNLNNDIIKNYNINIKILENTKVPNTSFKEMNIKKTPTYIKDLLTKTSYTKTNIIIWDYQDIKDFIEETSNIILSTLKKD